KAISSNCRVNLNPHCIFGDAPKRLYMQVLLYPLKKQLHLPSVFIKHRNLGCADLKIISKISEGPLVLHRIIANTPEKNWVFFLCLLSRKPYRLVIENVIRTFKKVISLNDFI